MDLRLVSCSRGFIFKSFMFCCLLSLVEKHFDISFLKQIVNDVRRVNKIPQFNQLMLILSRWHVVPDVEDALVPGPRIKGSAARLC
jgi:hypothetical protein